jgi:xylulose-5-phosphate/fructose-6-phosphate phosphoketolase
VHGHVNTERFHVRGFNEQGTTTTPFGMVVLNGMSRYHLAAEALRRAPRIGNRAPELIDECESLISEAVEYARQHFEDSPDIRDWVWTDP